PVRSSQSRARRVRLRSPPRHPRRCARPLGVELPQAGAARLGARLLPASQGGPMSGLLKLPFLVVWRIVTLGAGRREIRRIADRIARYADRFANAGRAELAQVARRYAAKARMCFTAAGARDVEEEFLVRIGAKRPRPTGPSLVGADDTGRDRAQDG